MQTNDNNSIVHDSVTTVELFTRTSPPCPFCLEAKQWIEENLPNAEIIEYDMRKDTEKWKELYRREPKARIPPQIAIILHNGRRRHIGGYDQLLQAFSIPA
jgi:glutaredoxin